MATVKKRKAKKDPKDILAAVIDADLLKERKASRETNTEVKETKKEEVQTKEKKWFEEPIDRKLFVIKKYDNFYYAHYKKWKENVWIGKYGTLKEANSTVDYYVEECNKPRLERNIDTAKIHSFVLKIEK